MRFNILAGIAAGLLLFATAQAQQTSGNIIGEGKAGDVVAAEGSSTGFNRKITLKKDGRYQMRGVPVGTYVVTVQHADGTVEEGKAVNVQVGGTARVQ